MNFYNKFENKKQIDYVCVQKLKPLWYIIALTKTENKIFYNIKLANQTKTI